MVPFIAKVPFVVSQPTSRYSDWITVTVAGALLLGTCTLQLYVNMSRGRPPRSRTRMQERKVCQVGVWDSGSPLWGLRVDSCPTVLEVEVMSGPGWAI